jgi:G3E family GTPase
MAPTWEGDTSRHDRRDQRPGRDGRRGSSRRHDFADREWGHAPWEFHHHHHHDHDDRTDPSRQRRGRRRERFEADEYGQALQRLIDAIRAAGRTGDGPRHAAVAVMDGATRAIYRLLAEEAEAPADTASTGTALSPEPEADSTPGSTVA